MALLPQNRDRGVVFFERERDQALISHHVCLETSHEYALSYQSLSQSLGLLSQYSPQPLRVPERPHLFSTGW